VEWKCISWICLKAHMGKRGILQHGHVATAPFVCFCEQLARQTLYLLRPLFFWQFSRLNVWRVNFSYSFQCPITCHVPYSSFTLFLLSVRCAQCSFNSGSHLSSSILSHIICVRRSVYFIRVTLGLVATCVGTGPHLLLSNPVCYLKLFIMYIWMF
jgi:hypothetical protein